MPETPHEGRSHLPTNQYQNQSRGYEACANFYNQDMDKRTDNTRRRPADELNAKGLAVSEHEMHGHAPAKAKDTWIFNAEATSTLLIAAWYVFGIYITLGILPENGFHEWGNHWVIPFLLAVFYLGAGYLYQKHQRVTDLRSWGTYIKREAVVLLTPFLAFLVLTLLATSVASMLPGLIDSGLAAGHPTFTIPNLIHAVFVDPVGPVGYFVILLGIYMITRTPKTRAGLAWLLACSLAAKVVAVILADVGLSSEVPYYLMGIMDNWIWFSAGIAICSFDLQKLLAHPATAICFAAIFIGSGALLLALGIIEAASLGVLTLLGLATFYSVSASRFLRGDQNRFYGFVTRYTMAIWLMHQILSVLVFCALYALGFHEGGTFDATWVPVNAVACLIACYPLPILAMDALSHIGKLGFIVYPSRYLPASFNAQRKSDVIPPRVFRESIVLRLTQSAPKSIHCAKGRTVGGSKDRQGPKP